MAQPGEPGYTQLASQAFRFFRTTANGRYSSRTLMRLARLGDEGETRLPIILGAGTPYTYDELTETKSGGLIGMCVWWPTEDGRCLLTVKGEYRRKKIGSSFLMFTHEYLAMLGTPTFWVGRSNRGAQMFLLHNGAYPVAINSNGAVQYSAARPEDGDSDSSPNVEPAPERFNDQPLQRYYVDTNVFVDPPIFVDDNGSPLW